MSFKLGSKFFLISLFILFSDKSLFSQIPELDLSDDLDAEEIEAILEDPDNLEIDNLDLNGISREDLERSGILSGNDIEKIISFRKHTKIKSKHDLKKAGLSKQTIRNILPYLELSSESNLKLSNKILLKSKLSKINSELAFRQKTKLTTESFTIGFSTDKDGPEANILDFYSYFIEYRLKLSILKKVIAGRYKVDIAQGLIFGSKSEIGKNSNSPTSVFRTKQPFKPYTGTYENWYFEGGCIYLQMGKFDFIPFLSITRRPVKLQENLISSFDENTIHEDKKERSFSTERIWGIRVLSSLSIGTLGISYANISYEYNFLEDKLPRSSQVYGIDWKLNLGNISWITEACSKAEQVGLITGIEYNQELIKHTILMRYYTRDFINTHCKPFSSQSRPKNERGIYYAFQLKLGRIRFKSYFDLWNYPAPRYLEKMPTSGSEYSLRLEWNIPNIKFISSLKHKNYDKYKSIQTSKIRALKKNTLKLDYSQKIKNLNFKTRFCYQDEYLDKEKIFCKGFYLSERIQIHSKYGQIIFQLLTYRSDILLYYYESSVSGNIENLILKGDGSRLALVLKRDLFKHFNLQFKIGGELTKSDNTILCFSLNTEI